ncbi:uncharacterized protein LOC112090818 [Morus notabilis]|uniref:uncharacterized protein LOC112090818 n=1 Tax=Morus notabilis TaxID=981085 RepID=UPI000CED4C54|nr:uncharacterized protein LOC112090818 [Morus notabilis]
MAPPLPDKYRSPSIPLYVGRGDPDDHLEMYIGHMLLHGYGEAVAATMDITDREALMGALSSMKKITPFKRELNRKPPSSYKEFLARAQGYINAEEADANDPEHRSNKNKGTEQGSTPAKQDGKKHRGEGSGDKQPAATSNAPEAKKPRQEENCKPPLFQRYDFYHELTVGVEEVFNQVGRENLLRRPEPMRTDPSRRNQKKFCRFHGDVGHHTNDCADLKDEIERVIREGKLQEFKAERRPRNDGHGGDSRRSQKDYAHEARGVYQERLWSVSAVKTPRYSSTDVAFNEDDASGVHFPHNDALVVEAMIGNHTVCRILVDNGSSVDLLYSDCLEKIGIQKEQLEKTSRPLYGFTGDSVIPQGTIRLPITAREKPQQTTTMASFVVIKGGSQYNAVIGRPTLQALRAIISVYHQKVKFPTPNGVGEMKSNQYEARVAYSDALRGYD